MNYTWNKLNEYLFYIWHKYINNLIAQQVVNSGTYTFHHLVVNHKTKCERPPYEILDLPLG